MNTQNLTDELTVGNTKATLYTLQPARCTKHFAVAPMMEITDRYCRSFHRVLSRRATLYTEMITAAAIVHGVREKLLGFDAQEGPVVLQLGGCDPKLMSESAVVGEQFGYNAININCGCPSDRVKSGRFGACLMAEPGVVAECFAAMQAKVMIPVTVKCRIGIDRDDSFEPFENFVRVVREAGCETFIVHARKAWLDGLSPKENRNIPPLRYGYVERIKSLYPDTTFILNGGLQNHEDAMAACATVDGVMVGREACSNPWLLSQVDQLYYGAEQDDRSRFDVVEAFYPYIEQKLAEGVSLGRLVKPLLGLFHAEAGGRVWRRSLSETMWLDTAGLHTLQHSLQVVSDIAEDIASRKLAQNHD